MQTFQMFRIMTASTKTNYWFAVQQTSTAKQPLFFQGFQTKEHALRLRSFVIRLKMIY